MYEKHFQCPIRFRAARNVLVFNKADMDVSFVTYNADLLATVAPQLEAELKQQLAESDRRTAEKAAAFLDSKEPNKRAKLIDELLASPAYGRHMADVWQALLLPRSVTGVTIELRESTAMPR